MKLVIIIAIAFSFGILFFPQGADAKEFFPSINYRIDEIPTFCTKNPISNELKVSDKWIGFVEDAVLYWESELKNSSEYQQVWNMNFKKVADNSEYSDDCTVILEYEESILWSDVLGVFYIDEWFDVPIDEWLDRPIIAPNSGKILIFDESFTCVRVCENFDPQKIIYEVIVHEMGHSLGLGHFTYDERDRNQRVETGSTEFPSIMYPISSEFVPKATITSKDISKLQKLYGTFGFYAFSENKPTNLFDDTVTIIEGIPVNEFEYFIDTSISKEKIHEITSRYAPELLVASGQLDPNYMGSNYKIELQMFYPDGNIESFLVAPKASGEFQLTFQLDNTSPIGTYTIEPSYYGNYSEEFKITFEVVSSDEEIIVESTIIEENIKQFISYDYEIIISGKYIELSHDSSRKVSGYLAPNKNNLEIPSTPLYLFLDGYLISSTNVNDDLTFTFDVKPENSPSIDGTKLFVGFDKANRSTERDSEKHLVVWVEDPVIPEWVKNNAKWWADGLIDDDSFVQGIQYLIKEGVIETSSTVSESSDSKEIPEWIKNNAKWWADGLIDEDSFVQGIQYLVEQGVIKVS